jgi:hypothetical protein
MSITYDLIIKTLCSKKEENPFITKKNMMKYSNDFIFFKELFDDSFYRYGVGQQYSLWVSILYIIKDNYFTINHNDIIREAEYLNNNFKSLENFCDKIKLNFIIFDFKENNVDCIFNGEYFNPWVETIFLSKYDNFWEPICCNENKTFSYTSPKVNILKNKVLPNILDKINFVDDFDYIIKNTIDINDIIVDNDTFTTHNSIQQNLSKSKLNKMKKEDILQLIDDLNLSVTKLKPTKKDLINVIMSN